MVLERIGRRHDPGADSAATGVADPDDDQRRDRDDRRHLQDHRVGKFVDKNRDVAARFVRASLEGWKGYMNGR